MVVWLPCGDNHLFSFQLYFLHLILKIQGCFLYFIKRHFSGSRFQRCLGKERGHVFCIGCLGLAQCSSVISSQRIINVLMLHCIYIHSVHSSSLFTVQVHTVHTNIVIRNRCNWYKLQFLISVTAPVTCTSVTPSTSREQLKS